MKPLGGGWDELLAPLFADTRYQQIREFLKKEYATHTIYPDMYALYNCFRLTPVNQVKVVILGQDPYHEPGQAHGLCFSVPAGVPIPPSLQNIYQELQTDLGITPASTGDLTAWAKQGVLLLNTTLTVRAHQANSHAHCGWAWFTDNVIRLLAEHPTPKVFMLWGRNARSKAPLITGEQNLVLQSPHPSPLSAYHGFFGCRHFSQTNAFLTSHALPPIEWSLDQLR